MNILLIENEPKVADFMKGNENLTLKTIYKLSKALNHELINFSPQEFIQPTQNNTSNKWISETTITKKGKKKVHP